MCELRGFPGPGCPSGSWRSLNPSRRAQPDVTAGPVEPSAPTLSQLQNWAGSLSKVSLCYLGPSRSNLKGRNQSWRSTFKSFLQVVLVSKCYWGLGWYPRRRRVRRNGSMSTNTISCVFNNAAGLKSPRLHGEALHLISSRGQVKLALYDHSVLASRCESNTFQSL